MRLPLQQENCPDYYWSHAPSTGDDSNGHSLANLSSPPPPQLIRLTPLNPRVRGKVRVRIRVRLFTSNYFLEDKPLETHGQHYFVFNDNLPSQSYFNILPDERMGMSFTIAAGPRQRSHSQVRVSQDACPHFTFHIRDSPHLEGHVPVFISPKNRVAQLG
jgi:hypothetical protein